MLILKVYMQHMRVTVCDTFSHNRSVSFRVDTFILLNPLMRRVKITSTQMYAPLTE